MHIALISAQWRTTRDGNQTGQKSSDCGPMTNSQHHRQCWDWNAFQNCSELSPDRTSHFTSTFISGLLRYPGKGVDTLVKAVPCSQEPPVVQPHYEARAPGTFTEWGSERGLTIYKNWNVQRTRYYISEVIGQVQQLIKYHCLILKFLFKRTYCTKTSNLSKQSNTGLVAN